MINERGTLEEELTGAGGYVHIVLQINTERTCKSCAIAFPLFLPMAASVGLPSAVIIAAVMSGVALGSQACLYSDAIFMVAAGTGVSNTRQFEVVLPYTIIGAAAAAGLFLVVGFLA